MAQVANSNGFYCYSVLAGEAFVGWHGLIASNQVFTAGDVLHATVGYVQFDVTTDRLPLGVAASKRATSTGVHASALFYPAVDWIVYSGQTEGGETFSQGMIWAGHSFQGTTGKQEVSAASGTFRMWCIGYEPQMSIGKYARALVVFMQSKFTGKTYSTTTIAA